GIQSSSNTLFGRWRERPAVGRLGAAPFSGGRVSFVVPLNRSFIWFQTWSELRFHSFLILVLNSSSRFFCGFTSVTSSILARSGVVLPFLMIAYCLGRF